MDSLEDLMKLLPFHSWKKKKKTFAYKHTFFPSNVLDFIDALKPESMDMS